HGGGVSMRNSPRATAASAAVLLGAASMCPSLRYRDHAVPCHAGQALADLRTYMMRSTGPAPEGGVALSRTWLGAMREACDPVVQCNFTSNTAGAEIKNG